MDFEGVENHKAPLPVCCSNTQQKLGGFPIVVRWCHEVSKTARKLNVKFYMKPKDSFYDQICISVGFFKFSIFLPKLAGKYPLI